MRNNKLFWMAATLLTASPALAEEVASSGGSYLKPLGAGLAIGIAAIGGTMGQGKAVAAAMDGISRNPSAAGKMFINYVLGLALIESLVLLAWLTAGNILK
jgi:F-type H+-transporting ATPase subunit c